MERLRAAGAELAAMEREVAELLSRFEASEHDLGGGEARAASSSNAVLTKNRLAVLAGDLEKLQSQRIDGVDVSALTAAGQDEARAERRDLNRRADALHESAVELHRRCLERIARANM